MWWQVLCLAGVVAFGPACKRESSEPTPLPDKEPPSKAKPSFPYATSHSGVALVKKGRDLWIARDGIRLDPKEKPLVPLEGESIGAEYKQKGPHDLYIVPLAKALSQKEDKPMERDVVLHVDRAVRYRALTEVVFTLGQVGYSRWQFVVQSNEGALLAIPLEAPSPGKKIGPSASAAAALKGELDALELKALGTLGGAGSSAAASPAASASVPPGPKCGDLPLNLATVVTEAGFGVKAFSISLAPDCATAKSGTTIPIKDGRHDFAGLTACVTKVLGCSPAYASQHEAMIGAEPGIEFQTVVSSWDALRRRADGTPMLPDLMLTILR